MHLTRHWPVIALVGAVALFVASPAVAGSDRLTARGPLVRYSGDAPENAMAEVRATYDTTGDTTVVLRVSGMRPRTRYGVQVHERPCGRTVRAAGPRFQNVPDPEQPSDNPDFANAVNEIWLDVRTNGEGVGRSVASLPWQFHPRRRAGSVMIHAGYSNPGPVDAGSAGPALACFTVRF